MRITRVVLKNHVVLGDVDININSDIVMLYGLNGSGKSFLLSLLHPYAETLSVDGHYPILQNKSGYKQIDYLLDGQVYSTRHEYTKNKDSHSAKSYFYKQSKSGGFENLNPNGNRNTYKNLVSKYFGYSSDLEDIIYLHQKTCGIISAPQSKRLDFLKVLINDELEKLNEYQVGCETNYKKYKSVVSANMKKIEQYGNVSEIMTNIDVVENDIIINSETLNELESGHQEDSINLSNLKTELSNITISVDSIYDMIENINSSKSLYLLGDSVSLYKNEYLHCGKLMKSYIDKISELDTELSTVNVDEFKDISVSRDLLNEVQNEIKLYESKCAKYHNTEFQYRIESITDTLKFIYDADLAESDIELVLNICRDGKFKYMNRYVDLIEVLIESIDRSYKQLVNIDEILPPQTYVNKDYNCDSCDLYKMLDLQVQTKQSNLNILEEIEKSKSNIAAFKEKIKHIEDLSIVSDAINHYNKSTENFRDSVPEINSDRLFNIRSLSIDISNLEVLGNNLRHYDSLCVRRDSIIVDITKGLDIKNTYDHVTSLRTQKFELEKSLVEVKSRYDNLSWVTSCPNKYIDYTIEDFNKLLNRCKELANEISSMESKIFMNFGVIAKLKENLVKLNQRKGELSSMKTIVKTISDEIESMAKDLSDLESLRIVLNKDIPRSLILSRLKPIQKLVNSSLDKLNIDMQLNILLDSNNNNGSIIMEVLRGHRKTPDTRMLSSGETAIIGLLVNIVLASRFSYNIIKLDEIDSNLDYEIRDRYKDIVNSITTLTSIEQVFIISHNMSDVLDNAQIIQVGRYNKIDSDNIVKI